MNQNLGKERIVGYTANHHKYLVRGKEIFYQQLLILKFLINWKREKRKKSLYSHQKKPVIKVVVQPLITHTADMGKVGYLFRTHLGQGED